MHTPWISEALGPGSVGAVLPSPGGMADHRRRGRLGHPGSRLAVLEDVEGIGELAGPLLTPRLGVRGLGENPDGLVHSVLLGGDVAVLEFGLPGCQAVKLNGLGAVQGYSSPKQVVRPRDCVAQSVLVDLVCLGLQTRGAIGVGTDADLEGAAERLGGASGALI